MKLRRSAATAAATYIKLSPRKMDYSSFFGEQGTCSKYQTYGIVQRVSCRIMVNHQTLPTQNCGSFMCPVNDPVECQSSISMAQFLLHIIQRDARAGPSSWDDGLVRKLKDSLSFWHSLWDELSYLSCHACWLCLL